MAVKEATTYANAPEFSLDSALNMFRPGHRKWAPDFMRQLVGGDKEKQAWAGNLTQAALYAALQLASGGRGADAFPEGQDVELAREPLEVHPPAWCAALPPAGPLGFRSHHPLVHRAFARQDKNPGGIIAKPA